MTFHSPAPDPERRPSKKPDYRRLFIPDPAPLAPDDCVSIATPVTLLENEGRMEFFSAFNNDIALRSLTRGGWLSHQQVEFVPYERGEEEELTLIAHNIWSAIGGTVNQKVVDFHSFENKPGLLCRDMVPFSETPYGGIFEIGVQMKNPCSEPGSFSTEEVFFSFNKEGILTQVHAFGTVDAENTHDLPEEILEILRSPTSNNCNMLGHIFSPNSEEAKELVVEFLGDNFLERRLDIDLSARVIRNVIVSGKYLPIPTMLRTLALHT